MTITTNNNENGENGEENDGSFSHSGPGPAVLPSEMVKPKKFSEEYWAEKTDHIRCKAHRKNGNQCLRPALRGTTVCFRHGGAAPQVKSAARARLENAADRMARTLLGIADSAESEAVKLAAVKDALDRAGLGAKSEVTVELKPWERLMGDIAGVATISREQHRANQLGSVIDAEIVDPPTGEEGPVDRPSSDGDAVPADEASDDPDSVMPPYIEEPGTGLMTMEDAVAMDEMHGTARRWLGWPH
jgi:hypothetical protein